MAGPATARPTFPRPSDEMIDFLAGLPKAELHIHLEGAISVEQRRRIAARNGLPTTNPHAGWDLETGLTDPAKYLARFLAAQADDVSVLRHKRDFHDVVFEYLAESRAEGVVYAELMFDPQSHTSRGIAFDTVIGGIQSGRERALAEHGIESNLIMCIDRERSAAEAFEVLSAAKRWKRLIAGLGLDHAEEGNPPEKFKEVYAAARAERYRLTAHCDPDQHNSVQHIWQCLDLLRCERIDHGLNSLEDARLLQHLRANSTVLTTCPTWRPIDERPRRVDRIRRLYDAGLKVTLNTDDPGMFVSGTLGKMLPPVAAEGKFTDADMIRLMINAFEGSWAPLESRDKFVAMTRRYFADWQERKPQ